MSEIAQEKRADRLLFYRTGQILLILFIYLDLSFGQSTGDYAGYGEAMKLKKDFHYKEAIHHIDIAIQASENKLDTEKFIEYSIEKSSMYRLNGQYDSAMLTLHHLHSLYQNALLQGDASEAKYHFELGANYLNTGDLEKGKSCIEKSINILTTLNGEEDTLLAPCYNKLGTYYFFNKDYESALKQYNKAYSLVMKEKDNKSDIPAYLINLGICYSAMGNYKKAEELLQQSLFEMDQSNIQDFNLRFKIYNNLGKFYFDLSFYEKALYYYNEAEYYVKEHLITNTLDRGTIEWNKALVYLNNGDYNKSMYYMHEARKIFDFQYARNNPIISALNMDQGVIYEQLGLIDEALGLYRLSLKNAAIPVKIKTYRNIAILFMDQNKMVESGKYFDTCYAILDREVNLFPLEQAYTDLYYGNYLIQSNNKKALDYLNNSYKLLTGSFNEKHRDVAIVLHLIGDHYFRLKEIDSALYYYHRAMVALTPSYNERDILTNPADTSLQVDRYSIMILSKKAEILMVMYENNHDFKYLHSLLQVYDRIIYIIEEFNRLYRTEDSRLLLSESFHDLYKKSLEANLLAYEATGEEKYLEKAFEMSEKSKASILLSELKDENAIKMGLIPDELYQLEKVLRGNLFMFKTHIIEEEGKEHPNENRLTYMRSCMLNNERRYDSLISEYEKWYPEYYKLKYDPSVITVEKFQKELDNDEILVEYSITDKHLITFIISNSDISYHTSLLDSNLANRIFALRHNLFIPNAQKYSIDDFKDFQQLSYKLYCDLILPIKKKLTGTRIIIVPDQELAYLSFEALTENILNSDTLNFKSLPYLIRQYTFNYASSATIFAMGNQSGRPKLKKGVLAMAPSYPLVKRSIIEKYGDFGGAVYANRNLPGATWEAETILNYIKGDLLSEEEATETQFKAMAGDYDILHFAMHTFIDDKNPLSSVLSFYPLGEPPDDDALHTYEIYGLPLKGHLAVLSACSTGDGKIQKGEGVISLARAFAYAGIPSIVMTLWDVEDIISGQIIPDFYRLLSKGYYKDDALCQAKLLYLNSVNKQIEAHPAFWAGYVLYGNNKPVWKSKVEIYFIVLVILGLLIIFISLLLVRRYIQFRNSNLTQLTDLDSSSKFHRKDRF